MRCASGFTFISHWGWLKLRYIHGDDSIIYYPESADVDPRRAAEAQALADYNNAQGRAPRHKEEMAAIYGDLYTKEFDRLAKLKVGQSGPSPWRK